MDNSLACPFFVLDRPLLPKGEKAGPALAEAGDEGAVL